MAISDEKWRVLWGMVQKMWLYFRITMNAIWNRLRALLVMIRTTLPIGLFFGYVIAYLINWSNKTEVANRLDIIELILFICMTLFSLTIGVVIAIIKINSLPKK
ncbi:hypothetical protein [Cardiobacterium valvarum]|uniref:hypothetical protein n=1 Tax=Cardiobacterium valvarum TaxID=194702 RepID=UPI00155A5791|nr:hypothetical protein [Cardiobacterium valvarum]